MSDYNDRKAEEQMEGLTDKDIEDINKEFEGTIITDEEITEGVTNVEEENMELMSGREMMMKQAKESMWLRLKNRDSFTGKFVGVTDKDDKGQRLSDKFGPTIYWYFEVDGIKKTFNKKAKSFITAMGDVTPGQTVKVTCQGERTETRYIVEVIKGEIPKTEAI